MSVHRGPAGFGSARESASQDSSSRGARLIFVLTKEALLPSFSLGCSIATLNSLLGDLAFEKIGPVEGVVCADPPNASILQPDDDAIPAPQVPDPAVPDGVVGRLLRLRFALSPRPGKMKNSWKSRNSARPFASPNSKPLSHTDGNGEGESRQRRHPACLSHKRGSAPNG
jgi:hypothetical protein